MGIFCIAVGGGRPRCGVCRRTKDKGILAYKAADGELAWTCLSGKQSYSSPQACTVNGQKQIVMHDNSRAGGNRSSQWRNSVEAAAG